MKTATADTRIVSKFFAFFLGLLLVSASSFVLVFWFVKLQNRNIALVDIASRNQMLSQKIVSLVPLVASADTETAQPAKAALQQAIILHKQSLQVLKKGGVVPDIKDGPVVPAAQGTALALITRIGSLFEEHQHLTEAMLSVPVYLPGVTDSLGKQVVSPAFVQAAHRLNARFTHGNLLAADTELVQFYTAQMGQHQKQFLSWFVVILLINMIVIGLVFYYLKHSLKPLAAIAGHIQILAEGRIPLDFEVTRQDEIGKIRLAMNTLVGHLKAASQFAKEVAQGSVRPGSSRIQ